MREPRPTGARRAARRASPTRPPRLVLLLCALAVTGAAWVVLARAAISFGRSARRGDDAAWAFLGVAGVGAVACLFVALLLGARLVGVVREARRARPVGPAGDRPPRARGGRRARR